MTILYFTATGNSLYVAKQLDRSPVSIPQAIKEGRYEYYDDIIGVVSPVYCNQLPGIVFEFLSKAKLEAEYKFMILTYGHMNFNAAGFAAEQLKEKGFHYISAILMIDNYLPMFDIHKELSADKKIGEQLSVIMKDIWERKEDVPKVTKSDRLKSASLKKMLNKNPQFNDGSQIAVTEKCVGCGICVKVCPIGNFYLENGVAKRKSETCEFCLACANLCTNKAIVCRLSEKNPEARYRNPDITLCEIIKSNSQISS